MSAHTIGQVLRGLLLWLLIALAFWGLAGVLPGIDVPSFGAVLVTMALIAVLNALLPLLLCARCSTVASRESGSRNTRLQALRDPAIRRLSRRVGSRDTA